MSEYYTKLPKEDKVRYNDKLALVGLTNVQDRDPFLTSDKWIDDITKWPGVEFGQIYVYLIDSPGPYTRETMKAYRSLEAYNQYYSGWVHTCFVKAIDNHVLIKAKVKRSQAVTDKPHEAWVAVHRNDASITCAHCTCMAGLGGVCSHVAAVLFKVEACHRLGFNQISCTSAPCQWNQNFTKKVEPAPVTEISFKKPQKNQVIVTPVKPMSVKTKFADTASFLTKLKKANPTAVIFSITEPKIVSMPSTPSLPPVLHNLYRQEYELLSPEELRAKCIELFDDIKLNSSQAENLEKFTRRQRKCSAWYDHRKGRLTASNFYDITHTDTKGTSNKGLLMRIMQCSPVIGSKATDWGNVHEATALKEYVTLIGQHHTNFSARDSGLVLNEKYPFLGATPDSVVECECCGLGVVEVKCPYSKRDQAQCSVDEKAFYLSKHDCATPQCPPSLKTNSKYYAQVQGQIGLCGANYCDFVCWTPCGVHIERVMLNREYFENMICKLKKYFINIALPEILTAGVKHSEAGTAKAHCICGNGESYDNMIACDNSSCATEWYHFKCVGLKAIPKGKWLCIKCRKPTKRKANK